MEMAHAMVDTAVNTDSWLMETVHKEEADSRQQDAETEALFKHKHGIEIVALLSKHKTCHTVSVLQAIMSKICCHVLGVSKENAIMPCCEYSHHNVVPFSGGINGGMA